MNESKAKKGSKAPKDQKSAEGLNSAEGPCSFQEVTEQRGGPRDLRIASPVSPALDQLVYDVIGAGMRVHSILGPGLLENAYGDAYIVELERRRIPYDREVPIQMVYEQQRIRHYRLDLVVAKQVIVELKTVGASAPCSLISDADVPSTDPASGRDHPELS